MIAPLLVCLACCSADSGAAAGRSFVELQGQTHGSHDSSVTGVIRDGSGMPLQGATIVIRAATGTEQRATSGPDGRFAVPVLDPVDLVVVVRADGFAEAQQQVQAGQSTQPLVIVLKPATV